MIIGWGELGISWALPVFTVYVREGRFTRQQLDANPAFTVSIPVGKIDPKIFRVCGTMSGGVVLFGVAAHRCAVVRRLPSTAFYLLTSSQDVR